jgi:hypothetical protein
MTRLARTGYFLCHAAAALSLAACPSRERSRSAEEELVDLGRQVGFAFPAGSRLIGIKRYSGMDDAVRAKVAIPKGTWPSAEKSLPIPVNEMVPGASGLGPNREWWDPETPAGLRSGQKSRGSGRFMRIGVDDSQREVVILYVLEHGT